MISILPQYVAPEMVTLEFTDEAHLESFLKNPFLTFERYQELLVEAMKKPNFSEIFHTFLSSTHFSQLNAFYLCEKATALSDDLPLEMLLRNLQFKNEERDFVLELLISHDKVEYLWLLLDKEDNAVELATLYHLNQRLLEKYQEKGIKKSEDLELFISYILQGYSFIEILGQEKGFELFKLGMSSGKESSILEPFFEIQASGDFDIGLKTALSKNLNVLEKISRHTRQLPSTIEYALSVAPNLQAAFYVNMITSL